MTSAAGTPPASKPRQALQQLVPGPGPGLYLRLTVAVVSSIGRKPPPAEEEEEEEEEKEEEEETPTVCVFGDNPQTRRLCVAAVMEPRSAAVTGSSLKKPR
ncbi:uncharacterized protein V6R79_008098 [Siganus canaliculatus]